MLGVNLGGVWASLWLVSGVLEVIFAPGSTLAWVFLSIAFVYWILKIFESFLSGNLKTLLGVLTGALWLVSLLFLL